MIATVADLFRIRDSSDDSSSDMSTIRPWTGRVVETESQIIARKRWACQRESVMRRDGNACRFGRRAKSRGADERRRRTVPALSGSWTTIRTIPPDGFDLVAGREIVVCLERRSPPKAAMAGYRSATHLTV